MNLDQNIARIRAVIAETRGNADRFADTLKRRSIPHLSFSQIKTVECCDYRYYLQYIALVEPDPIPVYFEKGKLLHHVIASTYRKLSSGEKISLEEYDDLIELHFRDIHGSHLKNAVRVHLENLWMDCQVVAVEEPFVVVLHESLPPCVGVVDLILRRADSLILIDHKTGRDFYPQDVLQMAIYRRFAKRQFEAPAFRFFYDDYRWVNNLDRIRKPALQRTEVLFPERYWATNWERILDGYKKINRITRERRARKNGECFRCPFGPSCVSQNARGQVPGNRICPMEDFDGPADFAPT